MRRVPLGSWTPEVPVKDGNAIADESETSTQDLKVYVEDALEWVTKNFSATDLLAVLHSNNKLILWNTLTASPIWKKYINELLLGFSLDPFNEKQMFFVGANFVLYYEDFSTHSEPVSSGTKFYIKDSADVEEPFEARKSNRSFTSSAVKSARAFLGRGFNLGVQSTAKDPLLVDSDKDCSTVRPCLQVFFHRYRKHTAVLVYLRKIMLVDLLLLETIETIALDKYFANLQAVYSFQHIDGFVCLHENGALSVRVYINDAYQVITATEGLKRSKSLCAVNLTVDSNLERTVCVSLNDGSIQSWKLLPNPSVHKSLSSLASIADLFCTSPPNLQLEFFDNNRNSIVSLRLISTFLSAQPGPTACKICPVPWLLQLNNKLPHESLIAIGNASGCVQVCYILLNYTLFLKL
ncbi:WD repeat-containing protein 11 [Cichlidogyrus casuarinus]|uniref:WD repeat-containing protein 11 n=1 Tax=Cichlidogyrus casuarinus TaxID=1844966 RepID=A0ABD2QGS3_9PLAT